MRAAWQTFGCCVDGAFPFQPSMVGCYESLRDDYKAKARRAGGCTIGRGQRRKRYRASVRSGLPIDRLVPAQLRRAVFELLAEGGGLRERWRSTEATKQSLHRT